MYDSAINDLNEMIKAKEYAKVAVNSSFSNNMLNAVGYCRCKITYEYVEKYLKYFENLNFWETDKNKEE